MKEKIKSEEIEEIKKEDFEEKKSAVIEAGAKMEKQMARQRKHTSKVKSPQQERREEKYLAY